MRFFRGLGLAAGLVLVAAPRVVAQDGQRGRTYWTDVALGENTCGQVTIQPGPTEITPLASPDSITVTHAGQTYTGRLLPGGHFTTTPRELVFGTTTYTIAISGQLAGDELNATVAVGVRESGATQGCRYTVNWKGRKQ